jgi:hypothetical protein
MISKATPRRPRQRFRPMALAAAVLLTGMSLAACGDDAPASPPEPAALSGVELQGDFSGSGPGTLKSAKTLPTIDRRLRATSSVAARITYTSTSGIDNSQTTVSGTVFAPKGAPPEGGWPIIAFGHPTTGTQEGCAPSLSPDLLTLSVVVTGLVKAGFVVAVSDYQGLGVNGTYHPYLDATTEGYNLIDSVRAARKLVPNTSTRWAATGGSQGGQAAWAANELADAYGKGMELVGTVSFSAPIDISGFADAAAAGQLTEDQIPVLQSLLASLKNERPDFDLDDYRRGLVKEKWDVLSVCDGPETVERTKLVEKLSGDDLRPAGPAAVDALRGDLAQRSLPQRPASAPMLVIYGGDDQLIAPAWTDGALRRACEMGDTIDILMQPNKGHTDVDIGTVVPWITDRFAGVPAPNSCRSFLAPSPAAADEEGQP